MATITQIVRSIIDDLSDGVSELVLLVVVLAEQNSPLPEQLPPSANVVNETAKTLAKIARQLGVSGYGEFPEIAAEINEAADAVDAATGTMGRAVTLLQGGGDRKQGWNGLVDACRIMAGKTIRLLQIVYGADLKRLQLTADSLIDDLGNIDSHKNLGDPRNQKKFADDVQGLAQKALKLANFVRDKANDTDSPFSKDMLNKVAQGLRDRAKDLIDAGNAALQNPDLAPRVDDAIQKLKDEVARAKKAVQDAEPEPPALKKLNNLMPLLKKAQDSVAAVPKAVRQNPKGYERAQKEAKDDVGEVLRNIKPNPKLKRDADKIEEDLKNQILAARNALKSPNDPKANDELDKATNDLLNALNNLKKNNPDKQITPEQKNDFQKALDNLKKAFPTTYPDKKPANDEQEAYERFKDNLGNAKQAARDQNPKALNNHIRQAVDNAKDLMDKMKDPAKKLPPYQRQRKDDAAKDIEDLLPRLIQKGAPVTRKPNDEPAIEDLMDAIRRLKRAAGRGNDPKDERDLRDNWKDMLDNLKKVRDAANNGDPKEVDAGLQAIKDALNNLRKAGDRIAARHPDPQSIEQPLNDLEKAFEKFDAAAPKATRGDNNARKELDDLIPKMQKSWGDLDKATRATDISPIQDVEDALDNVVGAVDTANPSRITPAAKDLAQKMNDLDNHLQNLPDPKIREVGKKLMDDHLRPGMRDFLTKAKEAAQDPHRPGIADEVNDIANRMKHPLSELKRAIDPHPQQRRPEGQGAAVKRALENLRKALESGDPEAVRKALDDLRNALQKYNDAADDAVRAQKDPKKQDLLNKDGDELKELVGDIRRVDPTDQHAIRKLMDQIPDRIDDWLDTLNGDERDNAIKGFAKAKNLLATLGSIDGDDMDLGDLLTAAGDLSNLLRGLIGNTAATARKLGTSPEALTPAARAALDLDKLLREIEGGDYEQTSQDIELVMPEIIPVDHVFEKVDLKKARTFDQVAAGVAYEIHEQAKHISKEGDNLAKELANLAKAARAGDRQALLLAAKAASAHITAFCKQTNEWSQRIPGTNLQQKRIADNLIRCSMALRNYGTQLKILASVKAASIEESKDTDESLSSLTRSLGEAVNSALKDMIVTKEAILKVI